MAEADIFDLVKADLDARNANGLDEHDGLRLTIAVHRDWLKELYEELLDATVYIRILMEEQKNVRLRRGRAAAVRAGRATPR